MRVNGINSQINFGNVYLVESSTNSPYVKSRKLDDSTYGISQVLNNKTHRLYSKKDGNKIRTFFADKIHDYNGKNGAKMVRSGYNIFLITGKDISEYNKFIEPQRQKRKEIISNQFMSVNAKNFQLSRLENEETEFLSQKNEGTFKLNSSAFSGLMTYDQMMGYVPCNYKLDRISFYSYNKNQERTELKL